MTVLEGTVPEELPDAILAGDGWQAAPGRVLMRGAIGRFLIEEGVRVTLERPTIEQDAALAVQFLDAALAMILQQRGDVVLHGNAAITSQGAMVLCGESGSGKSTALTALLARGFAMLSDDITACRILHPGQVEVMPGMPHLHLDAHAAAQLGLDISGLPQYPWRRMKAMVPTSTQMATAPAPLRAIYVLRACDEDTVRTQQITGADKFTIVQQQLYGPLLPAQHQSLFPLLAKLAQQTEVYLLWRPAHRWAVEEILDVILTAKNA